jgi:type III pantothenate kinase
VTPDVVVDIGNTRMKWGLCRDGDVREVVRLPLDDTTTWEAELAKLTRTGFFAREWAVASVNPPALARFIEWAHSRGRTVVFEKHTDLPIRVNVDEPEKVGLDRLFGAVAARSLVPLGTPAITVDVGTAVTVNLIDADGVFQGGAIFPGPRLMARALNEFTAKLPFSEPTDGYADVAVPGKSTAAAIRAGILAAVGGGMVEISSMLADECRVPPWMFMTGGGGHLVNYYKLPWLAEMKLVPTLTLDGIRIAAEALP